MSDIFIGFASGLVVGTGFVAFLTVLGIIPRLIQLSKTDRYVRAYEYAVVLGALFGTYLSFSDITIHLSILAIIIWGAFHGVFIGMLAAALTEVLNVFPVLGKIFGSLFQWTIFVKY